ALLAQNQAAKPCRPAPTARHGGRPPALSQPLGFHVAGCSQALARNEGAVRSKLNLVTIDSCIAAHSRLVVTVERVPKESIPSSLPTATKAILGSPTCSGSTRTR